MKRYLFNNQWVTLDELHAASKSLTQPSDVTIWNSYAINKSGLLVSANEEDEFTETMYAVPEDNTGYCNLSTLETLGYSLLKPLPQITILGDVGFKSAMSLPAGNSGHLYFNHTGNVADRIPFDDSIETVLYYRYFTSVSVESTDRPAGLTLYSSGKQLAIRNNGSSTFMFYAVHAYKVASKEVETVQAWPTNGSNQTAWFIKWHDMYCWMDGTNTDWLTKEQWEYNNWSFTEVITCYTNQSHNLNNDKNLNPGESCVLYDYNGNTLERPSDSQWRVLYAVYNSGVYHSGDNGFEVTVGFLDLLGVTNVGNNPRQPRKLSAIVIQLIE